MDIDEFMDITKPIKRVVIPTSNQKKTWLPANEVDKIKIEPKTKQGADYAKVLQQEQEEKMRSTLNSTRTTSRLNDSSNTSISSFPEFEEPQFEKSEQLRAFRNLKAANKLPVMKYRNEILDTIRKNPIVIIKGDTGCGKSTQVPQMILDEAMYLNEHVNIMVTQPRRIAAVSLANHVAKERKCVVGSQVGYQIGLETEAEEETRLLYCTTGVALEKLVSLKNMRRYSHIIIDEVHERDEEMEFLLIVTKLFFAENSPNTKIILMSATFETDEFAEYFRTPSGDQMIKAPTINLDTTRQYKISEFFIEDLHYLAQKAEFNYDEPGIDTSIYNVAVASVLIFHKWETATPTESPTILIFLPGIQEIQEMHRCLDNEMKNQNLKLKIVLLHSSISSEQQKEVFKNVAEGYVKVILSTNIAESSITVPNVGYVIDFCLSRILEVDNSTGFARLRLTWASKNNLKQRAGRTGRTRNGRVYRLINKHFYEVSLFFSINSQQTNFQIFILELYGRI